MIFETAKDQMPSEDSITTEEELEITGSKGDNIKQSEDIKEHNSNRYVIDPSEMGEISLSPYTKMQLET